MQSDLDELQAAYDRFQIAKAAFDRVASREHEKFAEIIRLLNELNQAQKSFAESAARIIHCLK